MTEDTALDTSPTVNARCSHKHCERRGEYRMVGSCANCKSDPVVGVFTKGHDAQSGWGSPECPVCETRGKLYWRALAA